MKRLAFGEFHQKHFGPQQKAYWLSTILQQQENTQPETTSSSQHWQHSYYDFDQSQHDPNQYTEYSQADYNYYQSHADRSHHYEQQYTNEVHEEHQMDEEPEYAGLSKEAIEIFKFSEAYRKEKEIENQKYEEDPEDIENWQYDESNVYCSGGLEAPATSLVLLKPESERPPKNTKLRIHEELLNSSYLSSCLDNEDSTPVVLWPILPLKM